MQNDVRANTAAYAATYPATAGWHPVVAILAAFPVACFTCALLTDLVYAATSEMMWADFSAWLLAAGFGGGVVAGIAALINLVVIRRRMRRSGVAGGRMGLVVLLALVVLVVGFLDNLVHSRDAWTSVVPLGLALSALTVLALLATAWAAFGASRIRSRTAALTGAAE